MRRIVMPTHEFFPKRGGCGVYVEALAEAAQAFCPTVVWAPRHEALQGRGFAFEVRELPIRGNQGWPNVLTMAWALRGLVCNESEAVLCVAEPGALKALMVTGALGSKWPERLVLVLHGSELQQFWASRFWRGLFQKVLDQAERIGVVSAYNERFLREYFHVSGDRIRLVPGAPRARVLSLPLKEEKEALTLLTAGRVHPRKGQHAVLEALALLPPERQGGLRYRIVGPVVNGAYERRLRRLARQTCAEVVFEGALSEVALQQAYAEADVFVMTSMPFRRSVEGLGMVYLEAGVHACPSIAHNVGGVSDAVLHEQTGLLVQPDDRRGLAEAIERLVVNEKLRRELGAAARIHALSHSWEANAQALFDFI